MGALPPCPRDLPHLRQDSWDAGMKSSPRIPAPESALELRLRRALPSAQVRISVSEIAPGKVKGCLLAAHINRPTNGSGKCADSNPLVTPNGFSPFMMPFIISSAWGGTY